MPPQNLGLLSTLRTCNVHHSLCCHIRSTNKTNVGQNQVTENNKSSFVYYKIIGIDNAYLSFASSSFLKRLQNPISNQKPTIGKWSPIS